jgi:hypothetical protein
MRKLNFPVTEQTVNGGELFSVPPPDAMRERLIPLNTLGVEQLAARFGSTPARASISRWRSEGYPVDRDGPRVRLPYLVTIKKVHTSTRALHDFMVMVQALQEDIQNAGGVSAWRKSRRKSRK